MSTGDARVYDRIAPIYDLMEAPMEWLGGRSRRERVTGIDISGRMLERARDRAARLKRSPELRVADAESLPFDDDRFDTVTATCVFCSVDDPVRGLEEVRRDGIWREIVARPAPVPAH